jgi:1-acyl-sn-glycerol-3-phosphate acyltransferase
MVRVILVLAAYALMTAVLIPVQWLSLVLKLPTRRSIPVAYHRMNCALAGVRVRVIGAPSTERPLLVLANHSSWLDIVVITSILPVVFVAKREVAAWPFFGLLARLQRTVFVDRQRRHQVAEVNAEIGRRLAEGDPVVLFAEGTAGDGNRVLPFRSALVGAARDALAAGDRTGRVQIQPLSIAYTRLQGIPMGRQHRPLACWYGRVDLLPHLRRVIAEGAIDIVVTWGEPIAYDGTADRKAIARGTGATVRKLTLDALRSRPAAIKSAAR